MHGSATVGWLVAALCAVTGVWCVLRARGGSPRQRADAGAEATKGFGMAAMAVPALWDGEPVPAVVPAWCSVVFFGGLLVRESAAAVRDRGTPGARHGHAHHVIGAAAMVYMALAMAAGGAGAAGAHHGQHGGVPWVTAALLGYFAGYVLWAGTRLMPSAAAGAGTAGGVTAGPGHGGPGALGAPVTALLARQSGVVAGCRLAMAAGMFAMLLGV